jgi:hypothetical protein
MRSYFFISVVVLFLTSFILVWADEPENKRTLVRDDSILEFTFNEKEFDDVNTAHKIGELSKKTKEAILRKDWDAAIELQEQALLLGNDDKMLHRVSGLTVLTWIYEQQGKGALFPE